MSSVFPVLPFRFRRDMGSGVPAYRQVIDQILGGIASGALAPGDQLPTVRQLAVDLAINPNTSGRRPLSFAWGATGACAGRAPSGSSRSWTA